MNRVACILLPFIAIILFIHNAKATDADSLKTISIDELGITLLIPESWSGGQQQNIFVFTRDCDEVFCANLIIRSNANKEKMDLDKAASFLISSLGKRFKELKMVAVDDHTINDKQFKVLDYMFREEDVDLGGTTALAIRGDNIISISFMGLNQPKGSYVDARRMFAKMLDSIKL